MRATSTNSPLALALTVAVAFWTACSPPFLAGTGSPVGAGAPRVPVDTVQVRVAQGPLAPPREPLRLRLLLRNPGADSLRLVFPTAQRYDFEIRTDEEETVWRWSEGRMFAQVVEERSLAPGDSTRYEASHGQGLPPGRYVVVGWITARDPQLRDSLVIRVEPPSP